MSTDLFTSHSTYVEALKKAAQILIDGGLESARRDARLLLLAATGMTHADLLASPRQTLTLEQAHRLQAFLEERKKRVPVARILGEWEFWSLPFTLSAATLIPRPDSETVVAAALLNLGARRHDSEGVRILDLGTGSGCLLIALLHELPKARGLGVDLSEEALQIAAVNARRNQVGDRASFVQSDWHQAVVGQFDLIVSNPPYIAERVITGLEPEVRMHDPHLALSGGADGLAAYRVILPALSQLLAPNGVAVLEMGSDQSESLAQLAKPLGFEILGPYADFGARPRAYAFKKQ